MTEINSTHYCSAGQFDGGMCFIRKLPTECMQGCMYYHRKHPTVEQFEAEYGFPVPPDMPVWVDYNGWTLCTFQKSFDLECGIIIVSCTPWGKPPDTWRSE